MLLRIAVNLFSGDFPGVQAINPYRINYLPDPRSTLTH